MFISIFQKLLTLKNIMFLILLTLFLIFIVKEQNIAILFFASYVISCSLQPLVEKLSKKINRSFAAFAVVIMLVILILAFFVPLIILASHEIRPLISNMPQYLSSIKDFILALPFVDKTQLAQLEISDIVSTTTNFTSQFVNESINISKNFASSIIYLLAALIIIYYFLADKKIINQTYLSLFPSNMKEKAQNIIDAISNKIGGYVIAQITTMFSVGLLMTIGLLILRVDYAVLLGLITGILDIIPVVGPAIALIICLVVSFKSGLLTLGLITVVFAIAQWSENSLVRPFVFSKFLDLHPLIIYLFLFITAQNMGVVGVVFAPAIAATVCVLIEELYVKNIN